jgi:asparagine synthase (glutamine-hydrolysing)
MCGIAGILGLPPALALELAPRMLRALSHRGPDDEGTQVVHWPDRFGSHPAVLLQSRLSILDLTAAGHQPMQDRPGDAAPSPNWIVFNGEIFNFHDLQVPLTAAGWSCQTRCDTEVILNAYRVGGRDCVKDFRGMFAWCLIDSAAGAAWFCRDRLGIKPLYLFRPAGGGLLFASELRALLAAGPEIIPPIISPGALESFLSQGSVDGLDSIVRGVRLLGPGEEMLTDANGRQLQRRTYWSVPAPDPSIRDRTAAVAKLGQTLREAVKMRLIADVPLGLFLSGGVDSASLVAVATEVAGSDIQTVSIGFDQKEFDESEQAAAIARGFGTTHRNIHLKGDDVCADLPEVLAAMDQPTVDGFNTFFVSRAARRAGLTVALSGLGGDELFGGYASFRDVPRAVAWQEIFRRVPGRKTLAGAM